MNGSRQQAMTVSFSGIDGAGKSTQIQNLCSSLQSAGLQVQIVTFWDDVARLKAIREGAGHKIFKGDKGVGTPDAPIERRDKNVRSPLMTLVRLGIYVIDAMSLRKIAGRARNSGADIVIFDRYIYDELANLNMESFFARLYLRGITMIAPRSEIGFVLDADPEQARARKPEYPLEFLHLSRKSYIGLSKLIAGMTVVPPLPLEQAKAAVVAYVMRRWVAYTAKEAPEDTGLDNSDFRPQKEMDEQGARPVIS